MQQAKNVHIYVYLLVAQIWQIMFSTLGKRKRERERDDVMSVVGTSVRRLFNFFFISMENLNMDVILRSFFCLTNASNLNKNTEDFQNLDKKLISPSLCCTSKRLAYTKEEK